MIRAMLFTGCVLAYMGFGLAPFLSPATAPIVDTINIVAANIINFISIIST